ncbi:MAG: hypothetical protein IMZ71_05490 [Chloroflexi bacterium]|nr:hypothetical protein [Chloroflexota bacterium]
MQGNAVTEIDPLDEYRMNWTAFIEDWLGLRTWSAMRIVAESVQQNQRTSWRSCHGLSKTITAAAIAVTFLNLYKPSIVITTAPTGRQVKELLWKEIRTIYQKQPGLAGECQTVDIRVDPEWYMLGFSTDVAQNIEGFHGKNILWVLDEAKGLPQWLYDAIEGSLTGGFARVLEISTTDGADQQCPFRKHHSSQRRNWNCIHTSALDSPFVPVGYRRDLERYRNDELLAYGKPGEGKEWPDALRSEIQIATPAWIEDREKGWKASRPDLWESKVLGEFASSSESNIIPIEWVESAIDAKVDAGGQQEWGLDVARMGNDTTVLTDKLGKQVRRQEVWGKKNTMETVGMVMTITRKEGIVKVDANGLGAGVFDRLAELGHPVIGIDSAERALEEDLYLNARAEMWFGARAIFEEQFKRGNTLSIPDDPELVEDLTGIHYKIRSDGKHQVEAKEEYRKRYGRSPDKGDSLVYCLSRYAVEEGEE